MYRDTWLWNRQQDQERDMVLAWRIANFSRAKKIPSIDNLLRRMRLSTKVTTDEDVQETKQAIEDAAKEMALYRAQQARKKAAEIKENG